MYSAAPWPEWSVPPGYLTAHGYRLMKIFGAWDRAQFAREGLLSVTGCGNAAQVTIYADTDQRTRETGKALAEGLFPGCAPPVLGLAEGANDPLFHPRQSGSSSANSALAAAAISGGIGGDPKNIAGAYRSWLTELDAILAKCGGSGAATTKRQSILDIPATLSARDGSRSAELRSPLSVASTLTENLLLEYAEGMDASNVGWGCVNESNLDELLELHTAESEIAQRPMPIARYQASGLLDQILSAHEQAAANKPVSGAIGHAGDRALIIVGHDTNIASIAGLLGLHWIADARKDDTPPGGALEFELWQSRTSHNYSVLAYYTTQTLDQMRSEVVLNAENPPARAPLFLPGCGREDFSCALPEFEETLNRAPPRWRRQQMTSATSI